MAKDPNIVLIDLGIQKTCFLLFLLFDKTYNMNNEVCMRNISMERRICRLYCGIKTKRLLTLIYHNTSLSAHG